jgi:hypothetical protein
MRASPAEHSTASLPVLPAAALIAAALLVSCIEQARILAGLSTRYTDEDQGVLWTAALDWGRLQMREPTFYGQDYGVTFEAIPAALLHALHVPYAIALPTGLAALGLASWWACAWAAWSRGWRVSSLAAAAGPILVSTEHSVVVSVFGTGAGRFIAACAAALLIAHGRSRRGAALSVACSVFALQVDPASALLAGPVLVWGCGRLWYARAYWPAVLGGALIALGWLGLRMLYNLRHPDHVLHPATDFTPALRYLQTNLAHPDNLLAIQAPELCQSATFVFMSIVTLASIALISRAWVELLALASFVVLLGLLASLWKSTDGLDTIWFRAARTTLMVPLAGWFLAVVVLQAAGARRQFSSARVARATALTIALLAFGTASLRAVGLRGQLQRLAQVGVADRGYPLRSVEAVQEICRAVASSAAAADTRIVIFLNDELSASFACHALYPNLVTTFPGYERRWWVLRQLMDHDSTRMLLWNAKRKSCQRSAWRSVLSACSGAGGAEGITVSFPPQPPLRVLHALGVTPRPFGPDCHPLQPASCRIWASQFD